jgi:hypothetical protein
MPNHSFATPEDHCASEPPVKRVTLHGNAVNAVYAWSMMQVMEIRWAGGRTVTAVISDSMSARQTHLRR